MAEINFFCRNCGQNIVADSGAAGLSADCPKCGQAVTIPAYPWSGGAFRECGEEVGFDALYHTQTELAHVREQWEATTEHCERLDSNAVHTQIELQAFQGERTIFRSELSRLRVKLAAAEEHNAAHIQSQSRWEAALLNAKAALSEMERDLHQALADNARAEERRMEAEELLKANHQRLVIAEENAEALSDAGILADNKVLRDIIDRQNTEIERRQLELSGLRRARFALRMFHATILCALLVMLWIGTRMLIGQGGFVGL